MNTTHTPGPWRYMATPASGYTDWGVKIGRDTIGVYVEADARLIAAAPETAAERDRLKTINADLLAALEDLQALIRRDIGPKFADAMPQCLRARDLIVRARGTA